MAYKYALVYQAGIANVFQVDCFNLSSHGRNAVRLFQGSFRDAEMFAAGLLASSQSVLVCHCNQAGDIWESTWSDNLDDAPFRSESGAKVLQRTGSKMNPDFQRGLYRDLWDQYNQTRSAIKELVKMENKARSFTHVINLLEKHGEDIRTKIWHLDLWFEEHKLSATEQ